MDLIGYEFLRTSLSLSAFPVRRPARVRPVTRVQDEGDYLAVPRDVAPATSAALDHLLFALKHEGTNLSILVQTMERLAPDTLLGALRHSPNGAYVRIACFLWEVSTGQTLSDLPAIGGPVADVFDPRRYVTGRSQRNSKWRVNFNGLGTPAYCATVERSEVVQAGINADVLSQVNAFLGGLQPGLMDRALAWAYLHETEGSFAIEREAPDEDKARNFVRLLQQAHEGRPVTEQYLVELQSSAVTNPFSKAVQFRTEQNWLRGPARGAAGITYLPPPPDLAHELMRQWMVFANTAPQQPELDPIVAASIASFGLVFIHPFMDGNGRLSRFMFHQTLCQSGRLANGLILPVSVAMKRHEEDYLQTLKAFSMPARELWRVRWIDEGRYDFEFTGHPSIYRYWDATGCVEFGFRMAQQALDVELQQEAAFLQRYDDLYRQINARYDVQANDLADLILMCLQNDGVVSKNRRKQFSGRVPEGLFDYLENCARPAGPT